MTNRKCLSVVARYRKYLESLGAKPAKTNYDAYFVNREDSLDHLLSMLSEMERFIVEGRREKFFRWLGFMQGALWALGDFNLNEVRDHNRPPGSKFRSKNE